MNPAESSWLRWARWLTFASAVAVLFSIAIAQILLALAFATLLFSGAPLRLPRFWPPLAVFLALTLVSLAFSGDPASGLPQVRKIYVYLELVVVFSALRDLTLVRRLFLAWAGVGALIAVRGFVQFAGKLAEAHALGRKFYDYYVPQRITGFMSHWMTFSGQEMFVVLMLGAFLFYAPQARRRTWLWLLCGTLVMLALLLGFTRSIWLATAVGGLYLAWSWNKRVVLALPVVAAIMLAVSPGSVRERFTSAFQPRKDIDSNQHRIVTWRTGLRMIRAHPWLGLGPEQVKWQFDAYVPADVPRPLPMGWYGHLHNIYLHYAAERGIPAMLALVWMLVRILLDFNRQIRRLAPGRSELQFLLRGAVAVVLATMVEGIFELNLGDSEVLTMFLVVVGCGYLALEHAEVRQPEQAVA